MITTYHNISFGTQTVPEQIPVVQGDTGREIVFILTDFTIPEGATATYYVQKPSGEAVYNTATISENNIIVPLTAQSIIEVGENDMQVRVILDEDIVTSFRAILMVRPFLGIGAVESSTEINIFDQAVEAAKEEINATIESAETALDEAVDEAIIEVHENALAFYVTDEASGAIATFPDGADLVPVKALTVEIEPVQSGSGDPSPSNVRPISGWSEAKVTRTGKNLLKYNNGMAGGTSNDITYTYNSDKTWVVNGTSTGVSMWLLWTGVTKSELPVGRYTYSRGVISSNVQLYIDKFNGGTRVGQITHMLNVENDTFDIDWSDYDTLNFGFWINTGVTVSNLSVKPMLRLASVSDATYEPYQGETYEIDLDGTRYGGTLDVGTGVLTVTHGYVDLGTLTWNYDSNNTRFFANVSGGKIYAGASGQTTSLCTQYAYSALSDFASKDKVFCTGSGTVSMSACYVTVKDTAYSDATVFKTAMSGVQLVYELATPQTVQLTAEQVTTLLGQNCIFADCGDVTVAYRADTRLYIDKILNA